MAQYYSAGNYSLALRSTIASCMTNVRVADVKVVNVTALLSERRRLGGTSSAAVTTITVLAATTTTGITASYLVTARSKLGQGSLQQQLLSASTSGFFDAQLNFFGTRCSTPGFMNATSLGVLVFTAAPSPAPSWPPTQRPTVTLIPGLGQVL